MNFQMIAKIFELKGMIESLVQVADQDENYNYSMIDKLEKKIKELVSLVEQSQENHA